MHTLIIRLNYGAELWCPELWCQCLEGGAKEAPRRKRQCLEGSSMRRHQDCRLTVRDRPLWRRCDFTETLVVVLATPILGSNG